MSREVSWRSSHDLVHSWSQPICSKCPSSGVGRGCAQAPCQTSQRKLKFKKALALPQTGAGVSWGAARGFQFKQITNNLRETESKTGFLQQNAAYRNGCGQQMMFFDKCHRWTRGQLTYPGFQKQVYNQVPTAAVILTLKCSGENY